jgi:hypothetical protein
MFITNKIEVKISPSNFKHFFEMYRDIKVGDIISVPIEQLNTGSHSLIDVKCDCCHKEKSIKWNEYNKVYSNGDYLCRYCKRKENLQKTHGVDNVFQLETVKNKTIKTIKEKYGCDNISQLDEIKEKANNSRKKKLETSNKKRKETVVEKYAVDNISQLETVKKIKEENWLNKTDIEKKNIQEKRNKTNIEIFGKECIFSIPKYQEIIKQTNIEKYGVDNPSKNPIISQKISNTQRKMFIDNQPYLVEGFDYIMGCDICSGTFSIHRTLYYKRKEKENIICTTCNPISKNISSGEIELKLFISEIYDGEIIENTRNIINGELDIYLPEKKIAFEFNGVYWHSEKYRNKYFSCEEKGIKLFQIWEDDWVYRKDIIKSMIKTKLGIVKNKIYARNTVVKEVSSLVAKEFLEQNHLQGFVRSGIRIGLFHNDKLVEIATFIKEGNDYQLNRLCSERELVVVGGASKLINWFIKNYNRKIWTFSNNDYSSGEMYEKIGFTKFSKIKPDYHYVSSGIRIHKFNFRKNKLSKVLKVYDPLLSESENCIRNGIDKVWDSGKIKWLKVG